MTVAGVPGAGSKIRLQLSQSLGYLCLIQEPEG
jgi:hypothetical protein